MCTICIQIKLYFWSTVLGNGLVRPQMKQKSKLNRANQWSEPNFGSSSTWQSWNELLGPEDNQDSPAPRALCHFAGFRSNASRGSVRSFSSVGFRWWEIGRWDSVGGVPELAWQLLKEPLLLLLKGSWIRSGWRWKWSGCGWGCGAALRWLIVRLQREGYACWWQVGLDWIWQEWEPLEVT